MSDELSRIVVEADSLETIYAQVRRVTKHGVVFDPDTAATKWALRVVGSSDALVWHDGWWEEVSGRDLSMVRIGPGSGIGALTAGETYIGYMGVTEDPLATAPDDRYEAVAVVEVR